VKRFLGGALLALIVHIATGQVSYPPGFIPYYNDCATRTLAERNLCHDNSGIYSGPFQIGLAKEKVNGHVMLIEMSGADGPNDLEYLYTDRGRATNTNNTSDAANTASRQQLPPVSGFIKTLYCRTSANPHAGATFTYTVRVDGVNSSLSCSVNDASLSCTDNTNIAPFSAGSYMSIEFDDNTLTDGTQIMACTAEAVY